MVSSPVSPLRFEVHLIDLDPTQGSEIRKTRPCVVVSPDEMNRHLRSIIIAPMTSTLRGYPSRVNFTFQRKHGQVALDQIRTVDKSRLVRKLGSVPAETAQLIAGTLQEVFAYDTPSPA